MAILSTIEGLEIGKEFGQFASENKHLTDAYIRERAKAAPNVAGLNTEVEAIYDAVLLALYDETAPTILP
jgi:hypothetical protein